MYHHACGHTTRNDRELPHTTAIELLDVTYCMPYKPSRIRQYWPERLPAERRRTLLAQWSKLRRTLASQITNAPMLIPPTSMLAEL